MKASLNTLLALFILALAACTPGVSVSNVAVSPGTAEIKVNEIYKLTAKVFGSSGISQAVTWTSGDSSIASVDSDGTVIGIKPGEVAITATSKIDSSKKRSATVKVIAGVNSVSLDNSGDPILLSKVGKKTAQLTATVIGDPGINTSVTWTSDNPAIATVDDTGLVTAIDVGTTTLTAASVADPSKSASVGVQVVGQLTFGAYTAVAATANQPASLDIAPNIAGGDGNYTFSGPSPALPAGLTLTATGHIIGKPTAASSQKTYTVTATDGLGASATASVAITVNAAPAFVASSYNSGSLSLTAGAPFTSAAPLITGGTAPFQYTIAPLLGTGLSLNKDTGVISADVTTSATPAATYVVIVKDKNEAMATKSLIIAISSGIGASFTQTRALTVGRAIAPANYSLTASGGNAPYIFSATGLPTGWAVSSSGVITGTPATTATISFPVTVTDANLATGTVQVTFTVNAAPSFTTAYVTPKVLVRGVAYTSETPTIAGGTGPVNNPYSISPVLPGGLTLNTANGVISGTPNARLAQTSYTITYTDLNGARATTALTLTVLRFAATYTVTQPITAGVDIIEFNAMPLVPPGNYGVSTVDGVGILNFTLSPSSPSPLPAGISLVPTTGKFTGNTTQTGTFDLIINASDSSTPAQTDTANITLVVNPPLTLNYNAGTNILNVTNLLPIGVLSNGTPQTTGGTFLGAKQFTLGAVTTAPSGTAFGDEFSVSTTTGAISKLKANTPIGTYSATVVLRDANWAQVNVPITITVTAAAS